jgi:hypothetical protein
MNNDDNFVLYDSIKNLKKNGNFKGSIISINKEPLNSIIFSDNIIINDEKISITNGLLVGFEGLPNEKQAFSKRSNFNWERLECSIEYSVLIPSEMMELYDEGQFSEAFPYTINLLHTAGLYLNDNQFPINHIDFFKGEILKNPISLVFNGFCVADRISIDYRGDPVFYDCIIVGRDQNDDLKISFDPILNLKMDDDVVKYIIVIGIEELKL